MKSPSHSRHPHLSAQSQFTASPNPPSAYNFCYPMSHTLESVVPQAWCTLPRYPPTIPRPSQYTLPPAIRGLSRGDWNVCWGISLRAADGLEAPGVPQCSVLTSLWMLDEPPLRIVCTHTQTETHIQLDMHSYTSLHSVTYSSLTAWMSWTPNPLLWPLTLLPTSLYPRTQIPCHNNDD